MKSLSASAQMAITSLIKADINDLIRQMQNTPKCEVQEAEQLSTLLADAETLLTEWSAYVSQ